jgi:hypothetical protein
VVVVGDVRVEVVPDGGERGRSLVGPERERLDALQRHRADHTERAEVDPGGVEELGAGCAGDDFAARGDDLEPRDERRQAPEAGPGAVRTGGQRPGDRLHVDVAEVGQGQPVRGEQEVQMVQAHPGLDGHLTGGGVHPDG